MAMDYARISGSPEMLVMVCASADQKPRILYLTWEDKPTQYKATLSLADFAKKYPPEPGTIWFAVADARNLA